MTASILIIEDDKDIQKIYSHFLSDRYNITQLYDTKDAWRIIERKHIDLIILDIILPKSKNGDSFYLQIRQHPMHQSIPVIVVSVIDDPEEMRVFEEINNVAWITKPFKRQQLIDKIDEMLQNS